jgi:uncharacterized alpha-E superfamily protein
MLSRVAENIYWIGRYLERTENTARLLNVYSNMMLDLPKGLTLGWEPLIRITGCEDIYREHHDEVTERRVVNFMVSDSNNPSSILSTISFARENARTIREILPREAWEELNTFHQQLLETKHTANARQYRHECLIGIIRKLQQHTGLMAGSMNHDTAYCFLNVGRKLERADMTTRVIDAESDNPLSDDDVELRPFEDTLLMSMLESLSAYQMYRQSMQTRINRKDVLNFLLRKPEFPRSLSYSTHNIAYNLSCLPNNRKPQLVLRHIEKVIHNAPVAEMDDDVLHAFVDRLQIELGRLHDAIASTYFPPTVETL